MSGRRCCETAGGALPGTLLVLLPKCPACLAAWLATSAGLGISAAAASRLRMLLIALCLASIAWLVTRTIRRT